MYAKLFSAFTAVALAASFALADDNPIIRVRSSELAKKPLSAGALRITITKLRSSVLKIGVGYLAVKVENTSAEFITFSPQRLSLVNKDNTQVDMLTRLWGGDNNITLRDRSIAPQASIEESYQIDNRIKLPARLYYDQRLIAEIIE